MNVGHLDLIKANLNLPVFQSDYQELLAGADKLLLKNNFEFVTHKTELPPSGDIHDYVSVFRYSDGDGISNPLIANYDRPRLAIFSSAVYTLSLAYFFSGNEDYAEKASELVYSWFLDESTRMNPNMKHAQINSNIEGNVGSGQGIIDANDFILIIEAVSLLFDSDHWPPNYHVNLKKWFYDFSIWIIKNYNADAYERTNVSTWLDVQRAIYFLFSEQEDRLNSDFHIMPIKNRIDAQFQPDGRQPHELSRNRQRHYEYFNLRAYMNLALIRKNNTAQDRDWPKLQTEHYGGLKPALDLIKKDVLNFNEKRTLLDNSDFNECRYLEIFKPAAIAFNANDYNEASELLRSNGCSNPDINLVFPPLTLVEF